MRVRPDKLGRKWLRKARLPAAWLRSRALARRHREDFASLERFVLFVGYPRSGHSLIGSLLDAHPEAIVAHELHVLRYLRYGFSREQIFALLLERSAEQASAGRSFTGYDYVVPDQWQGRFTRLRVIGDKRGGTTIRKLSSRPHLLPKLERVIGLPVHYVHVVRNPWDNVATIFRRGESRDLAEACEHYLSMVRGVQRFRERVPASAVLDVYHERFVAQPREELVRLCRFVGLEADDGYLEACAKLVWTRPNRTRDQIAWPAEVRDRIARACDEVPFLRAYAAEAP
jgi:hypothetical protein